MLSREQIIECYMLNEKHVIAEMLFDTISKYESQLEELQSRSCDGCKHYGLDGLNFYCKLYEKDFDYVCIRNTAPDRYEPKESNEID